MDRLEKFTQTYSQAPWRKQWQLIGLFFAILVFFALVAGIYLNVSARAATVGREIQELQKTSQALDREIEDLQSRLALIQSSREMGPRASSMGFEPIETDQIVYLNIPGYVEKQPPVLSSHSERTAVSAPVIPPEYTESLFAWLGKQANRIYRYIFEVEK